MFRLISVHSLFFRPNSLFFEILSLFNQLGELPGIITVVQRFPTSHLLRRPVAQALLDTSQARPLARRAPKIADQGTFQRCLSASFMRKIV
jgi:hypothetical protein